MSFPTRLRRAEDLWSVCLFRGVQKGASSLIISFFGHSGCVLSPCLQRTAADAPPVPCISMRRLRLQPRVLPNGEVKPESAARLQPPGSAPFTALAGTPAAQGANSGPGKSSPPALWRPACRAAGWMVEARQRLTPLPTGYGEMPPPPPAWLLLFWTGGRFSRSHKAPIYGTCLIIISSGNLGREGSKREAGGGAKGSD